MLEKFIKLILLCFVLFIIVAVSGAFVAWSWNGFFPLVFGLPYIDYGNAVSLVAFLSMIFALFGNQNKK